LRSCKTCVHYMPHESFDNECCAQSPCVDESWHSWKAKDKTEELAARSDYDWKQRKEEHL